MGVFSEWIDTLKDVSTGVKDVASDVSEIRTDWQATQEIYAGDSGVNVPVQQAKAPAKVAQAQGNVNSATQWNAPSAAPKAVSGTLGGINSSTLLIAGGAALLLLLMVRR